MTNHLWHGHLPWTINSCAALLGCCPLSKPLCQCTAGVNNSQSSPPLPCCIHLISFHQYFLGPGDSDIFFFLGWGMRANRRQAGVIGVTFGGCWGTPAAVFLKLLPLYLCHSMPPLPPSLTVPCPSASCRFLIKENISLIAPPLILPSPLTPSSSVLSFISLPLPCEATWLTSISLSLESLSWAPVCARHAQTKCFSILLYFFSLFIPPRIWELLPWTLLSHETGGKPR